MASSPTRTPTPVGCGEAKVYVTNGRTNTCLHALEPCELVNWSNNPVTDVKDLRIVSKGTLVDLSCTITHEQRKFVQVAEGPHQGLFVTESRTAAAKGPLVTGFSPIFSFKRETFFAVGVMSACAAWNYPRTSLAATAAVVAAAKTGLITWGVNRFYHGHDFFAGVIITIPIPIPYLGWSVDLSV